MGWWSFFVDGGRVRHGGGGRYVFWRILVLGGFFVDEKNR